MDRQDVLKRLLYPKCKTAIEFKFDNLLVNPLLSYITVQDIAQLNKIATSLKYSSKPKEKYVMIDKIMTNRGFKKMASGTNRVTYRCLNDYRVVIKIAIDKVGLSDNGNEYRNQHLLKPFVTKCFEISPCGTVGLFERVIPITSREEFINLSDDIFDLINNLIGKYVLEDIGEKFYMNYGLREGFGPVLLDYPYVFELDGRKLICNVPEPMEPKGYCGGEIDYDLGYNDLVCKKCGKRYLATELKSDVKSDKPKIIIEGDDIIMRCVLRRGDEIVSKLNSEAPVATNTIKSKRDFVNLKARVSEKKEEKEEVIKPTVKTSDDVKLKARLRRPGNKNVNEENKRKESTENNQRTIKVDLSSTPKVEPDKPEVSDFSVKLSDKPDINYETIIRSRDLREKLKNPSFVVCIRNNNEIWDVTKNELIGYTVEECKKRVVDTYSLCQTDNDESAIAEPKRDVSKEDDSISGKGSEELIAKAEASKTEFKGNQNYKTADFVAPISNHFSDTKLNKAEPVVEDKKEIPELIIHPREDEEEYSDNDEYDPEYDNQDSEDEEKNKIDLY